MVVLAIVFDRSGFEHLSAVLLPFYAAGHDHGSDE
jgi:hypothetical protein